VRGGGRGGRGQEEGVGIGEARNRRSPHGTGEEFRIERLRKLAEGERRRADALEERVERQSAVVTALADAVRRLAQDPDDRPEAAGLAEVLADAGILGDEASRSDEGSAEAAASAAGLTRREREVLALAERGMTNREIGEALFISENTVRKHLKGANRALGTSKKAEAVHAARRLGAL
jgi:DNA-binding CsgD family transcriptional regulator